MAEQIQTRTRSISWRGVTNTPTVYDKLRRGGGGGVDGRKEMSGREQYTQGIACPKCQAAL